MTPQLVLHDAATREWLRFRQPAQILTTSLVDEVLPLMQFIDQLVNEHGYYAAGFLSYEAAPAFDPALPTYPPGSFPLLWFGIFENVERLTLPEPTTSVGIECQWVPSISRVNYERAFQQVKQYLGQGETYQVNFTFRLKSHFQGNPWDWFLTLAQAQQADYGAFVDLGSLVLCSASPELFFQLDGRQLISRPMKGTAARACTSVDDQAQADWLFHSEKNRAENIMIVDMIRNDLGRVAQVGSVTVPKLFEIERYPTVWQMTSTVAATTDEPVWKILKALFPCASITGAPKARSMKIIAELESDPRHIYTGSIGYLAPGRKAQFNVAIRTVWLDRATGQAEFGVGGGIVWDSEHKDEYLECQTKARVLTSRWDDFQLFESLLWTPEDGYFLVSNHLSRLRDSAAYFGFSWDESRLVAELERIAHRLPQVAHKVKVFVSRHGQISHEWMALPVCAASGTVKARVALSPVRSTDRFLYHKTTRRAVYAQALASFPDCDDVVLWNERGEITESTRANVVIRMNGRLVTPPVSSGLLAGTFRNWLIENGELTEQIISREDFERAEARFLINSVRKWQAVELFDGSFQEDTVVPYRLSR
ncbi:MAG: aminodeoxychorismate synthase component I [Acidobacteria bacterium]|nr:aminodeoxychorismate synthase component I [Acidobacteriota bacterium]